MDLGDGGGGDGQMQRAHRKLVDRWLSEEAQTWELALAKPIQAANGYDALAQKDYSVSAAHMAYNGFPNEPSFWSPSWLPDVLRVTTLALRYYRPTDPSWVAVGAPTNALGWTFLEGKIGKQ